MGPGLVVTSMHQKIINIGTMKFTPSKAEQSLQGMELQQNEAHKKIKAHRKSFQKERTVNNCLLIPDLKPFRL